MRAAIVGGGFSGAATAYALLRRSPSVRAIDVFEPRNEIGRGIAYAEGPDNLLLNVPAHTLAVLPDEVGHFLNWVRLVKTNARNFGEPDGSYYFPRSWFGEWVQHLLGEARAARPDVILTHRRELVTALTDTQLGISVLATNVERIYDRIVLAIGNPPARPPVEVASGKDGVRFHHSAWGLDLSSIEATETIVIIGAGLSMIDALVQLRRLDHCGRIICVSRKGRLPHVSRGMIEIVDPVEPLQFDRASDLIRELRRWAVELEASGGTWRTAVDHARRNSKLYWGALDAQDKARFLRHARSIWEMHRFQIPPAGHREMQALAAAGRFAHVRGYPVRIDESGLMVRTGNGEEHISCSVVINATGFDSTFRSAPADLGNLLGFTGLDLDSVRRWGVGIDDSGRVLGTHRKLFGRAYANGFLARANHGELGTVNCIGAVAEAIACDIAAQFSKSHREEAQA